MVRAGRCTSTLQGPTGHCCLGSATSPWLRLAGPGSAGGHGSWLVLEHSGSAATPGAGVATLVGAGGKCSWPGEGAELLVHVLHYSTGHGCRAGGNAAVILQFWDSEHGSWGLREPGWNWEQSESATPSTKKKSLPPYYALTEEAQLKKPAKLKFTKKRERKKGKHCTFFFFPLPCLLWTYYCIK